MRIAFLLALVACDDPAPRPTDPDVGAIVAALLDAAAAGVSLGTSDREGDACYVHGIVPPALRAAASGVRDSVGGVYGAPGWSYDVSECSRETVDVRQRIDDALTLAAGTVAPVIDAIGPSGRACYEAAYAEAAIEWLFGATAEVIGNLTDPEWSGVGDVPPVSIEVEGCDP